MKRLFVLLANTFYKPLVKRYISSETFYLYEKLKIIVLPGVFHPRFFFSTKLLLKYLKEVDLKNKSFLELGAGSGLIALYVASQGAKVTASDISSIAIENIKKNQEMNGIHFPLIHSDLFDKVPIQKFDYISINPPYYKKNPITEPEHAWYCGEQGEYFIKLFSQLSVYIHEKSNVIMILSDVCDIPLIKKIAKEKGFEFTLQKEAKLLLEINFIFSISTTGSNSK